MSGWTFETDSDLHPLGLLGTTSQGADPVAIEALVNESVSVWRKDGQDGTGPPWGLTVFSHTTQPEVALDTQR